MATDLLVAGIETSGPRGSVALLRGGRLLGEETLGEGVTHGVSLHPALERLLAAAGARATDLGLVAAGTGPGSFTGMRVGVAAARSLAFAAKCPVIGIPSYDAMAAGVPEGVPAVACARDARRGEAWFALYGAAGAGGAREARIPPCRRTVTHAVEALPAQGLVLGDLAAALAAAKGAPGLRAEGEETAAPRASVVARLGLAALLRGGAPDPASVLPLYLQEPLALRKGEGVRRG